MKLRKLINLKEMINRRVSKVKAFVVFTVVNLILILAIIKFYKLSVIVSLKGNSFPETRRILLARDIGKKSCTPKKNVVFIKTHKTGSSTITNILSRYGDRNNLAFALPKDGYNRLGWPWFLRLDHVVHYNNTTPNILSSHSRYNRAVLEQLMPNDTIYVTILRDPVTQFESTFSYMRFGELLGISNKSDPLVAFFENPKEILVNYLLTQDLRIYSDRLKLIRNGMFFDLGLEPKDFENQDRIDKSITELNFQFDLVMVMEHFDESLVLLKRLLCWDINDMMYFHLNERRSSHKRTHFPHSLVDKIRNWSSADVKLYEHFRNILIDKLSNQDEEFNNEVKSLQLRNYYLQHLCLTENNDASSQGLYDANVRTFTIRQNITSALRRTCDRMLWDEIKYLRYLRRKQDDMLGTKTSWFGSIPGYKWLVSTIFS